MRKDISRKIITTIVVFLGIGALLVDVLIFYSIMKPWHYVQDGYLEGVFSALCTIAAVGNGVLALAVNALQSMMYGVTLKELLALKGSTIDIKSTVSDSLILVLISIPCFIFEFCNMITFALAVAVLLILITSVEIWKLITSEDYYYKCLVYIIEREEKSKIIVLFSKLYSGFEVAVHNKDENDQEKCLTLINTMIERAQELNIEIFGTLQEKTCNLFLIAAKSLGFTRAYSKVVLLGKKTGRLSYRYNSNHKSIL